MLEISQMAISYGKQQAKTLEPLGTDLIKIPSIYPQAFDLIAMNYTSNENGLPIIQATNNDISFMLYNKGGYSQTYMYNLFDAGASDLPMFENQSGQITLEPEQNYELSFAVNNIQADDKR